MNRTVVRTASRFEVKESFVRAVAVGDLILVSNTSGRDYDKQELSPTVAGQTHQALDNITRVLEALGSSLEDVVRRVVTIPNPDHATEVMTILGERFQNVLSSNTVICSSLGPVDFLVEIEVTAYRGAGAMPTETIRV